MLKVRTVKLLKNDIKDLKEFLKNDFEDFDNHHSIKKLVIDIGESLEVTRKSIENVLWLYEL